MGKVPGSSCCGTSSAFPSLSCPWACLSSAKTDTFLVSLLNAAGPSEDLSWSSCSELLLITGSLVIFEAPSSSMDLPRCASTRARRWPSATAFFRDSSVELIWRLTQTSRTRIGDTAYLVFYTKHKSFWTKVHRSLKTNTIGKTDLRPATVFFFDPVFLRTRLF